MWMEVMMSCGLPCRSQPVQIHHPRPSLCRGAWSLSCCSQQLCRQSRSRPETPVDAPEAPHSAQEDTCTACGLWGHTWTWCWLTDPRGLVQLDVDCSCVNANVNVNNLLAMSESDFDSTGEPGPRTLCTSRGSKPPGNPPPTTARNSQGLLLC